MKIESIDDLIDTLERVRVRLHPSILSHEQYREIGWADRPLRQLIDQCNRERELGDEQTHPAAVSRASLRVVS